MRKLNIVFDSHLKVELEEGFLVGRKEDNLGKSRPQLAFW